MSADPSDADPLITPVMEVVGEVESLILSIIAAGVAAGDTVAQITARITAMVQGLSVAAAQAFTRALGEATTVGQVTAEDDAPEPRRRPPPRNPPNLRNPAISVVRDLIATSPRRARGMTETLNRQVTDAMTGDQYGTRRAAAADLMARYAENGVVGYRDAAGRNWDLASYAEVVTRTTTAQTVVASHLDRLADCGRDLVQVSDAPEECKICREWEGKILSVTGQTPRGTHADGGVRFVVHGTVAQARAAGVGHPNCRHRFTLYVPGVSPPMTATRDPEGARLREQQRYRERQVRAAKRAVIAAEAAEGRDGPTARRERARLRARQQAHNEWVKANGRKKLPGRLRLDVR